MYFNPRSPHGERRTGLQMNDTPKRFQSTLPARGATAPAGTGARNSRISIHAPRTGSDPGRTAPTKMQSHFNPRSPHGERPKGGEGRGKACKFQSTLPARGATRLTRAGSGTGRFQSTLPARGATCLQSAIERDVSISIHAPRTGSDAERWPLLSGLQYFNPRSPHGERRDGTLLLFAAQ